MIIIIIVVVVRKFLFFFVHLYAYEWCGFDDGGSGGHVQFTISTKVKWRVHANESLCGRSIWNNNNFRSTRALEWMNGLVANGNGTVPAMEVEKKRNDEKASFVNYSWASLDVSFRFPSQTHFHIEHGINGLGSHDWDVREHQSGRRAVQTAAQTNDWKNEYFRRFCRL